MPSIENVFIAYLFRSLGITHTHVKAIAEPVLWPRTISLAFKSPSSIVAAMLNHSTFIPTHAGIREHTLFTIAFHLRSTSRHASPHINANVENISAHLGLLRHLYSSPLSFSVCSMSSIYLVYFAYIINS